MHPFTRNAAVLSAALLLALGSLPANAAGQPFELDPTHTQVRLNWDHFGFSRPGASFNVSQGLLVWDADDPAKSSVEVTLDAASAYTQVPLLDQMFRENYFETATYPEITFKSTAVKPLETAGHFQIEGELTVRDQTRPVTLDATLNRAGEHPMLKVPAIGFSATGRIQRSQFGLDAYVPFVSDEVQLSITVEALEPGALARALQGD